MDACVAALMADPSVKAVLDFSESSASSDDSPVSGCAENAKR